MEAHRVGQHAVLLDCSDGDEVAAAYAALLARAEEIGATDIVPAARTVLVGGVADPDRVLELVATLIAAPVNAPSSTLVELPTTYDGPDLDEVARQWQVSTAEVVRLHQGAEFVVAFCGFAPGFAYCTGLPPDRPVSRRAEPRTAVPPGSVALAGEFTGVYPTASPGGWQLIGTTSARLWRPTDPQPALLTPGTRVVFVDG